MFVFSRSIDDMTHEEIASECIRSSREDLVSLGRELQAAVDDERDSSSIVDQIAETAMTEEK